MKNFIYLLVFICFLGRISAQEVPVVPSQELKEQILKTQNLTPEQLQKLEQMGKKSEEKTSQEKSKFAENQPEEPEQEADQEENDDEQGERMKRRMQSPIFGYDFFSNSKISFAPNRNLPTPEGYIIGTGDEILIEIWGAAENRLVQRVDNQGNINLSRIGKLHLGGLSFVQAKQRIQSALSKIYAGILASEGSFEKIYTGISLSNVRTIRVNIIGEVKAPGSYSVSGLSTILNALYTCGGPTENGSFRNIKLIRAGREIVVLDVYDFLVSGSQKGNLNLNDEDVILVPSYQNRVEVKGQVKRQGIYEMRPNETLADLQKFFGGFTPTAYTENIIVERIEGAKRKVEEVAFNDASSFKINNGDRITIHELANIYHNRLSIAGAVYQPGSYAFSQGVTAYDLIQKAAGIRAEAYLKRGLIFRADLPPKIIEFSVSDVLSQKENIPLQASDSLYIYNRAYIENSLKIRVDGAVKNPITIPYMKGIKVEDAILMAGGFVEGADPSAVQIGRQVNDENFKEISRVVDVSVSDDLKISAQSTELQPNDVVTVRFQKGYTKQQVVSIRGEVVSAGHYVVSNKEERISDLIERAGGLTPYAYLKGAILIRTKDTPDNLRVGIHLDKIIKNKGGEHDLILKEGDELIIPSEKQTIVVSGEVLSQVMTRYEKGKSVRSYIHSAGGFSSRAKRNSVYVIYANGDVKGTKNFLFFRSYPKIEPGAVIVVPERPERRSISISEGVGIATSVTTLGVLIYNILK